MALKVLVADDHALMRRGLVQVLEKETGICIVGEASNGTEAVEKTRSLSPDVVILDISMPDMNGLAAASTIRQEFPEAAVVILTVFDDDEYVLEAAKVGVSAYVMKDVDPSELVKAVRAAAEGKTYVHPAVAPKLLKGFSRYYGDKCAALDALTKREVEVLDLVSQGFSNREISDRLFISEKTVKNHLSNIFGKIGVDDRTQAALYGLKHGLGARVVGRRTAV
ncbi:MAG: response regulator transcription factor [Firmicutes bacterium]|nr:response regulator transcription factor [Bacillota bacterium]